LNTAYLLVSLLVFLNNGGGTGGNIFADEIAGIGLGAAALVGAVGYLVMRRRSKKQN
jgi:hypothetical protein